MTDHSLPSILHQMLVDINNPACHYWLYCNYFEVQPPTQRTVTRWYHAPLFLNYDSIWEAQLVDGGMLCDVILKNALPAERERIKIDFDQIYRINRFWNGENITQPASELYSDQSVFKVPPTA
ncbi:hypothetical protein [Spirosoma pomorum]